MADGDISVMPAASGGAGGGAVTSVSGRTGDVVITGADVGAGALPALRLAAQTIAGAATLVTGTAAWVKVDTTSAAFTITLPATPTAGDILVFEDSTGQFATNNLTVNPNGKTINGAAGNQTLIENNMLWGLYYDGAGWFTFVRSLSNTTPLMDGTAAAGTGHTGARRDHVHPTDTSRAPNASPTFTGTVTLPSGNAPWGIAQAGLLARLNQRSKSPAAHGMSFWTALPEACNSSPFAYTVSTLYLARLYDVPPQTITNLLTAIGSNGTSLTLAQLAAFTVSGTTATRVAITADQHVDWNTNGQATKALPVNSGTPYSFPGGDLILAVLQVGTTSAQLFAQNTGSSNAVIMNVNQLAASGNLYASQKASQATMPTSIDLTTCTALGVVMFMGGN